MNSYVLPLSCPECGSELSHVASGAPRPCEVRAVAHCPQCEREAVIVVIVSMGFQPDQADAAVRRKNAARKRAARRLVNA